MRFSFIKIANFTPIYKKDYITSIGVEKASTLEQVKTLKCVTSVTNRHQLVMMSI